MTLAERDYYQSVKKIAKSLEEISKSLTEILTELKNENDV